jgi:hypothetical protein
MRHLSILCAIIASVFISGCIQADTVIRVNPDGSGVIEETVKLSNALLESLQNISKSMAESAADADANGKDRPKAKAEDPIKGMMKDAQSREKLYGPDVRFVSVTPIKGKTMSGYKAIYAFKDISKLRINQNPESKTMKPADGNEKAAKKEEIILFSFVKGPVSTLTITLPENQPVNKPENAVEQPKNPETDPNAAEMMKAVFKDMSIKVSVHVAGAIVNTNATYHDNSRITLVDINFGKILENEKAFEKLNAAQPKTVADMKALLKDIKGLKVEMNNPVVVQFK